MAKITKELKSTILKWEGGYAGNIDQYACTMRGVTIDTFQKYYGKNKTCSDLKKLTDSQWEYIFKKGFWDKWSADYIESQAIANLVVDWVWASGKYGIIFPQRILGVKDDGIVGPKTINAINKYPNQKELFQKLWNRRKKHFEDIAGSGYKKKFLKGWLNRLNDFKWFE